MPEPHPARRRRRLATALGIGLVALGATIVLPPRPRVLWNASASAPVGLYVVSPASDFAHGDTVIARPPGAVRQLATTRRYLPANVPLVKRVVGLSGDRVCATGPTVRVNGRAVATRRDADGQGRPMPWWHGCVTLQGGALFLLMDDPASFDGRYFGPTAAGDIVGKARLSWPR